MGKHTKGPWNLYEYKNNFNTNQWINVHCGTKKIAHITGNYPEYRDNAELIAAAPELYQKLRLLRQCYSNTLIDRHKKEIDDLLAKAEGK